MHEFNPGGKVAENFGLTVGESTLADHFLRAGYSTALVGKWHLGWNAEFHPLQRGFQEFFGFLGGARPYLPGKRSVPFSRGREQIEEKEYLTDAFKREALDFVSRQKERPIHEDTLTQRVNPPLAASPCISVSSASSVVSIPGFRLIGTASAKPGQNVGNRRES